MSNLEQAVTTGFGAAIGFVIGGPAGALAGAQYGLLAGSVLFPGQLPGVEGPRLEDVERLAADPGEPIPIVYGTVCVAGFRLYMADTVTEVASTEEVGGKGAPEQEVTSYSYFQTLAIGLCEGPVNSVLRIWENGELVYDARPQQEGESDDDYNARVAIATEYAETFTFYQGTETQEPDPTIESEVGEGLVPGYRGLAYIVFPDRALRPDQANRHPAFKIEVSAPGNITETTIIAAGHPDNSRSVSTRSIDELEPWEDAGDHVGPNMGLASWLEYVDTEDRWILLGRVAAGDAPGNGPVNLSDDDGETWYTPTTSPPSWSEHKVLLRKPDSSFVVSVGGQSSFQSFYSLDGGLNWSAADSYTGNGATRQVLQRCAVIAGSLYVAVGAGFVWKSSDGRNWVRSNTNVASSPVSVAWDPLAERYVQIASNQIWNSQDAEVWTSRLTLTTDNVFANGGDVIWDDVNERLLAVGNEGVYRSTDGGHTWERLSDAPDRRSRLFSSARGIIYSYSEHSSGGNIQTSEFDYSEDGGVTWEQGNFSRVAHWKAMSEKRSQVATAGDVSLAEICADICERAGLTEDEYDVSDLEGESVRGYAVGRHATARGILEPVRMVGRFDYVESGGRIVFRVRGRAAVADLDADDLGAFEEGSQVPDDVVSTRTQDVELPRQIRLRYPSYARDYERGEQLSPARIGTVGVNEVPIDVPIVMDDDQAAQIAEILMREAWASRDTYEFPLGAAQHALEPADPITLPVDGRRHRVRIVQIDDAGLMVRRVQAVRDDDGAYVSSAISTAPVRPAPALVLVGDTELVLLDLPPLRDEDDGAGVYAAFWRTGTGQTWNGARLHRSVDDGATWQSIATVANQATVGTLVSAPASGDPHTWDDNGEIVVDIDTDDATLSSRTDAAVLAGANLLAIGEHGRWHLVQFANAELVSAGRYKLTRLLLGRRGTEHLIGTEEVGDRVVLLSGTGIIRVPLQKAQIGAALLYRAVSAGRNFSTADPESFTGTGQALETFSPVHGAISRDQSGNITVTWIRRDRLSETLRDGVPVPMSENSEAYEVDVLDGPNGSVKRTIDSLSTAEATYSAADQTTDFGGPQDPITVRIYQLSADVGRGQYLEVTG